MNRNGKTIERYDNIIRVEVVKDLSQEKSIGD